MVDRKEKEGTTRCTEQMEVDTVNSPPHYNNGGMECIDYIQQQLGEEDLRKAEWYLKEMIRDVDNRSMLG